MITVKKTKLYTGSKGSLTGPAHLRSEWAICGPRCEMSLAPRLQTAWAFLAPMQCLVEVWTEPLGSLFFLKMVAPIFKKVDQRVCSNYHPINGKVYLRMLKRRLWLATGGKKKNK